MNYRRWTCYTNHTYGRAMPIPHQYRLPDCRDNLGRHLSCQSIPMTPTGSAILMSLQSDDNFIIGCLDYDESMCHRKETIGIETCIENQEFSWCQLCHYRKVVVNPILSLLVAPEFVVIATYAATQTWKQCWSICHKFTGNVENASALDFKGTRQILPPKYYLVVPSCWGVQCSRFETWY